MTPFCPSCGVRVPRGSDSCENCGWDESQPIPAERPSPRQKNVIHRSTVRIVQDDPLPVYLADKPIQVHVTKVDLGLGDLITLMVKIAIAAVPAAIIAALLYAFIVSVIIGGLVNN